MTRKELNVLTTIGIYLGSFGIVGITLAQHQPPNGSNGTPTKVTGIPVVHHISYADATGSLITLGWESGSAELEMADINGDGNLDIATVGDHGSPFVNTNMHGITTWFGDGAGKWTLLQNGDFGYGGLAFGDVNNDGLMDIGWGVHHNYSSDDFGNQLMEVALGDGTGQNWQPWDDGLARDGQSWAMAGTDFADFNADGFLDIASVALGANDGLHVYLNNTDGTWTHSFGFLGGNSFQEIHSGDVNNDGYPDFVASHADGTVWINDGTGSFTVNDQNLPGKSQSFPRPGPDLGDVNGDGFDDVSFVSVPGGLEVWVWDDPSQQWVDFSGNLPNSGSMESTRLEDMNSDGRMDLVGFGQGQMVVFTGDGKGNWVQAAAFKVATTKTYAAMSIGDTDHNGFPDIAIVSDKKKGFFNTINQLHFYSETSNPTRANIRITSPASHRKMIGGSVVFADWVGAVPVMDVKDARVSLDISFSGRGGPWVSIVKDTLNNGRYQFNIPQGINSEDTFLRATLKTSAGNYLDIKGPFAVVVK